MIEKIFNCIIQNEILFANNFNKSLNFQRENIFHILRYKVEQKGLMEYSYMVRSIIQRHI